MAPSVLNYYDPEFVKGNEATNESDVYSLGIVLLELLASQKDGEVPCGPEQGRSWRRTPGRVCGRRRFRRLAGGRGERGHRDGVGVRETQRQAEEERGCHRQGALKRIAQDKVDEAGNVVTLMRLADKACGMARDQSANLPRFDKIARGRGRNSSSRRLSFRPGGEEGSREDGSKLKRSGASSQVVSDESLDAIFTPEQVKAAVFIQTRWRGIMARKKTRKLIAQKKGVALQEEDASTALTETAQRDGPGGARGRGARDFARGIFSAA